MKNTSFGPVSGRSLRAAAIALVLGAAPLQAVIAADQMVAVETARVAPELAAQLHAAPATLPASVDMPEKQAAAVCNATLKQLRDSKGADGRAHCSAAAMSQGLIQAVRQKMKNP